LYSGCNFYDNLDGTATSMHECGCDCQKDCKLKKPTETWDYNKSMDKEIDLEIKRLKGGR
jgi:hypothetical protein